MKQLAIRHSTASHEDYAKLIEYVVETSGIEAAAALDARLERSLETLATLPHRGRIVPELKQQGVYREILSGPYRIVYRVMADHVLLFAIVDGRRELDELLVARMLRESGPERGP